MKLNIIRDQRYRQLYARDMRRQWLRRGVHQLSSLYERCVWWPRWQQAKQSPTLSTCIITMNSAHRVRPLLEYIRLFSDEIVVGVDSKTTDHTFEVCDGLADELFIIENDALTCNAGLEALVGRCHGDWILRLDDDEFPEPLFNPLKAGILNQEKFTHYKLPRLHLASVRMDGPQQTPRMDWINDGYLYPDFQMRLFRNDPALLSYPGAVGHTSIMCDGPRGKVNTVNLVHLNMAINPRFKREEKLEKYVRRLDGEWVHPVNEHALLFEDFDYRLEPYNYPDERFLNLLAGTTLHQRGVYEANRQKGKG